MQINKINSVLTAALLGLVALAGLLLTTDNVTAVGGRFVGGVGTPGDPYQISDVNELQDMAMDLNAAYVLTQDIDASAMASPNATGSSDLSVTAVCSYIVSVPNRNSKAKTAVR